MNIEQSAQNVETKKQAYVSAQNTANNAGENYFIAAVNHCYTFNCPKVIEQLKQAVNGTPIAKAVNTFIADFTGYKKNDAGNSALDMTKQDLVFEKGKAILSKMGSEFADLNDWVKSYSKVKADTPEGRAEAAKKKAKRLEQARKTVAEADSNDLVMAKMHIAMENLRELSKSDPKTAYDMAESFANKTINSVQAGIASQLTNVS
jgi:regulator of protease activity HflC (stomatin/prohibitin superfamily)